MTTPSSFLGYFTHSTASIQCVILLLLAASLISWTFIFERTFFFKKMKKTVQIFEDIFWSGKDLTWVYHHFTEKDSPHYLQGLPHIFIAGFKEFMRLLKQTGMAPALVLEGAQRAMRVARAQEMDELEQHLSFLATVGSISPYIGLFGTVLGIMTALQALSTLQQVVIATVAPGISEALATTALGLFAAIPAVIAYNRFANDVEQLLNQYDTFQEEFSNLLARQVHQTTMPSLTSSASSTSSEAVG